MVRFLKENDEKAFDSSEIAKATKSTKFFVIKIAQDLIRAKIIESVRGVNGGFVASKKKVTALDVSSALGYQLSRSKTNSIDDKLAAQIYDVLKSMVI